jgi:pimeloyl-ACP methyl ester carboxylesterase
VQLATIQALARYWETEYDWRKCEARLKALPQFVTEIDAIDIHFIHVRSEHEDPLPLIVTHGWPGSIIEQLKIIDPLTNSTAHGGGASDAFHLVIPSLPGFGFSGKPTTTGWDPPRIARAMTTPVLRHQRQPRQGLHRPTRAQHRIRQPGQLVAARSGRHENPPGTATAQ